MQAIRLFVVAVALMVPVAVQAETFLDAPLMPGGKTKLKTDSRLEQSLDVSHDDALRFYREQLKNDKDIKFRGRSDHTFIEEYGTKPWHSISIMNKGSAEKKTEVIIVKDNWTWIIGTLTLRFVGVFVVLIVLYACMELSGAVLSRLGKTAEGTR